jgi:O-succinylhomoserine sulfhydrylase
MPKLHPETEAIRAQTERTQYGEHSVPIFPTSSFVFPSAEYAEGLFKGEEDGHIYSRYTNPNTDEFIQKLCLLEGTEDGISTASGMAAMFLSLASLLRKGDHLLASRSLFGSTHQIITQILPRWGINFTYVAIDQPETWEAAIRPETRMFFAETPSNPGLQLFDMQAASALCKKHGLLLTIDNCFATPVIQKPVDFGADLVTHSATKWMDGQGRVLGGAVLGTAKLVEEVRFMARHTGPALSPFHGWMLSKSLETLHVRMEKHAANALALASWLEKQKGVKKVNYPFLPSHPQHELAHKQMKSGGGLVTFELAGGKAEVFNFLNQLQLISLSSNLGDTRTIATHPASTTHSKLSEEEREAVGISPTLIRISVGLEHIDDIQNDITRALGSAKD